MLSTLNTFSVKLQEESATSKNPPCVCVCEYLESAYGVGVAKQLIDRMSNISQVPDTHTAVDCTCGYDILNTHTLAD